MRRFHCNIQWNVAASPSSDLSSEQINKRHKGPAGTILKKYTIPYPLYFSFWFSISAIYWLVHSIWLNDIHQIFRLFRLSSILIICSYCWTQMHTLLMFMTSDQFTWRIPFTACIFFLLFHTVYLHISATICGICKNSNCRLAGAQASHIWVSPAGASWEPSFRLVQHFLVQAFVALHHILLHQHHLMCSPLKTWCCSPCSFNPSTFPPLQRQIKQLYF